MSAPAPAATGEVADNGTGKVEAAHDAGKVNGYQMGGENLLVWRGVKRVFLSQSSHPARGHASIPSPPTPLPKRERGDHDVNER